MSKQLVIKRIDIYPHDVPLTAPFNTAVSSHSSVNNVAIQVTLADGAIGWGETPTKKLKQRNLPTVSKRIDQGHFKPASYCRVIWQTF